MSAFTAANVLPVSDREVMFKEMVRQFPDSPMGYFSLGRLFVDSKRWTEAVDMLTSAVRLDPTYAAAFVALGDAWAGSGNKPEAKEAWKRALQTPLGLRDASLQADLNQRMAELDEF
jgi:predicted Zn-dependent protease